MACYTEKNWRIGMRNCQAARRKYLMAFAGINEKRVNF
jgi:hypothetical protein